MRSPLALLALLLALAACSAERISGPTERAIPSNGQLLECHVDATALTFECGPVAGPERAGGLGTFGNQGVNIAMQSKRVRYSSVTQILSADVTVANLMGGPLGTIDGTANTGVDVFFLSEPTADVGTVTVDNPTGHAFFTATGQPYFHYSGILDPGEKSAVAVWMFQFAGGANSFTFWVLVSGMTPAQGAIQNWVLVPTFGSPLMQSVHGFGTDGQVTYGDSGEASYRVGGVWRSIYDTLAAPLVSSRFTFAHSTRDIWSYVDQGGVQTPRRWDGGNWRAMDEVTGYPGAGAIGIGTTGPGNYWAFGSGLWKLSGDTLWVGDTLPTGAASIKAMAPIGTKPLLIDNLGRAWFHDGVHYVSVAVGSGQLGAMTVLAVDTTNFWVVSAALSEAGLRRWTAGAWSTGSPPSGYTRSDGFVPVTGTIISNSEAYLIANNGNHGVVVRWDGSAWSLDHENLTVPYTGIWARNGSEVDLSLADGTVEVRIAGTWDPTNPKAVRPDPDVITGAWLSAEDQGYLVNEVGLIYHYTGGEPVVVDTETVTGSPGAKMSLWSSGPNNVWIAFGGSQLWHYDGPGVGLFPVPGVNIRAVGGSASNDVWGAANEGQIVHFDGTSWTPMTVTCGGVCQDWNAVWAYSSSFAVAVGDNGQVGMWDGTQWTVMEDGSRHFYAVSGSSPSNVWIGGQTGNGWQWDGFSWTEHDLPTSRDIVGVWVPSLQEGYAIAAGESYRWNGASWVALDIPAMRQGKGDNRAVTGAGNDAFIVGSRLFRGWR